MKQPIMNRRYSPLSLSGQGGARTVLLRMAEDQDRAARIGELKDSNPLLTWAEIARRVGVSERAATQWRRTGALKPENAEALARVFNVDFDYVWSGPRPGTPDVFVDRRSDPKPAGPVAVDRLEGALEARITQIERMLEQQNELLARQSEILERIADMLGPEALSRRADEAVKESIEQARAGLAASQTRATQQPAPGPVEGAGMQEPHRTPEA